MIQKLSILIICSFLSEIYSLNCRTEGSLKSDELKKIYNNCLKQQEGNNYSGSENSEDWQDRGSDGSEKERNKNQRNREENKNREPPKHWMDDRSDRYESDDSRQNYHDQGMDGKNQHNYGKSHNQNDRRMDNNHRMDGDYRTNANNYQQNYNNHEGQGLYQNGEYGSETKRNMYSYPNHRYKRDRSEKNSGQRSQYNPNTPRSDDNHRERNSSDNFKDGGKACAMHCFLDNLHMTGDNGMPDRYLVTNAMTKDVRNEDLRDFLQESIEECFQILDNENTEDKCDFSKNLLVCLSEKGRATCDDWKDDIQFN
ncbi:probable cyclin-dependent serine/threonine-protein kinase DDB_G0292550 [Pieris brassicae]|uniref:Uncharacterized protein n=1 Tax=Pieris brassicae TaxID=7116 RepID=A0A9P0TED1_PIEBR|nr:probable cyclin-dependent serine/threonine-protein kinase DDB_G0292550 [Pieris brassicae]CAH4028322.1 unnamed protein product [Pieris brassicae]